jgi:hypothetical protein
MFEYKEGQIMTLLEKLMDRVGATKVPRYAKESVWYHARIQETSEFKRIKNIPKGESFNKYQKEYLDSISLNRTFKHSISFKMKTWNIQSLALFHIEYYQGAFLPIGVGQGKALISLLAANEIECERPVLFVPAQLREQTKSFVIPEMKKHWKIHPNLKVIAYSELSLAKNANMLEELSPDLIILDECHSLAHKTAGRTKRMSRYLCVAMSGTIATRSLKDWAHIAYWCLRERTPVPLNYNELTLWANCLDAKIDEDKVVHPGALMQFCKEGENARQGFRRRLVETPGVVASKEDDLGVSLRILKKEIEVPSKIKNMIREMKQTWTTPQGDIITEAVALWRHIRELSLGFWYKWEVEPPREWMEARRAWKSCVRETLKHNRRGLDTELQVWNECENDFRKIPYGAGNEIWLKWKQIKDTFKPNTIAVWEDDFALKACRDWLLNNYNCICWVENPEFGKALENLCGYIANVTWSNGHKEKIKEISYSKYFGAGDDFILSTKANRIIASIGAHSQGKNLQKFNKNLIVSPPTSGKTWEQVLARTHRHGQQADEVTCEVFMHVEELEKSFEQARADARYLEDTYGNRQKLNYADIVI